MVLVSFLINKKQENMTMLSNYEERLVFAFGCSNIECTLQRLNMLAAIAVE